MVLVAAKSNQNNLNKVVIVIVQMYRNHYVGLKFNGDIDRQMANGEHRMVNVWTMRMPLYISGILARFRVSSETIINPLHI